MSVQYKMIQIADTINKPPKKGLKPSVVSKGTFDLKMLAKEISSASSLSEGDVYSSMINMRDMMVFLLQNGFNVKIDDLGTFSVTAQSRIVESASEIRAASIHFKRVAFRPARSLKDTMQKTQFERIKDKKI